MKLGSRVKDLGHKYYTCGSYKRAIENNQKA